MKHRSSGIVMLELILAMVIFTFGIGTLYAVLFNQLRLTRTCYKQGVVANVMEGEMLRLKIGDWKAYENNKLIPYAIPFLRRKNMPKGNMFIKTEESKEFKDVIRITLVWRPVYQKKYPEKKMTQYIYKRRDNE